MRAQLLAAHSWDTLESGSLREAGASSFLVEMTIGPAGQDYGDNFTVTVCRLDWLEACMREVSYYVPRHLLLTSHLSLDSAILFIRKIVNSVEGETWSDVSNLLSRYFRSEFEDYRP